jgi:integrase
MIVETQNGSFMVRPSRTMKRPSLGTFAARAAAQPLDQAARVWLDAALTSRHREPFSALLDRWAEWRGLVEPRRGTKCAAADDEAALEFEHQLRDAHGSQPAAEVVPKLANVIASGRPGERRQRETYTRQILRIAQACGYTDVPRVTACPQTRTDPTEVSRLLAEAERPPGDNQNEKRPKWFRLALYLIAGVGLRVSEVLALHWADVDLQNQALAVRRCYASKKRTVDDRVVVVWSIEEVSAFQCRSVLYGRAAFGLGPHIHRLLTEIAEERGLVTSAGAQLPPAAPYPIGADESSEVFQRYCERQLVFTTKHQPPKPSGTPKSAREAARWHPLTPSKGALNTAFRRLRDKADSSLQLYALRYACVDALRASMPTTDPDENAEAWRPFVRQYLGLASATDAMRNIGQLEGIANEP